MADRVFRLTTATGQPMIWDPDEVQRPHRESLAFPMVGRTSKSRPGARSLAAYDVVIRALRGLQSAMLFSDRGREAIAPVLGEEVGWYEAIVDGQPWHRMFVERELDLLDRQNSWMEKFPSGEVRPMHDHVAFKPHAVEETLFVLKGWDSSGVYVGEALAEKITALGIRGLQVKLAWTVGQTFSHLNEPAPTLATDSGWTEQPDPIFAAAAETLSEQGAELLEVDVNAAPLTVVEGIDSFLAQCLETGTTPAELDIAKLGFLYCEQFRRAANWEWTKICHTSNEHGFTPAVVSKDRSHAVLAKFVVGAALEALVDEGVPMTLVGSFVLARAGKLQPQPAKAYVLLW